MGTETTLRCHMTWAYGKAGNGNKTETGNALPYAHMTLLYI